MSKQKYEQVQQLLPEIWQQQGKHSVKQQSILDFQTSLW